MDFTLTPPSNKQVLFRVFGSYQARCSNYCVLFQVNNCWCLKRNKPTTDASPQHKLKAEKQPWEQIDCSQSHRYSYGGKYSPHANASQFRLSLVPVICPEKHWLSICPTTNFSVNKLAAYLLCYKDLGAMTWEPFPNSSWRYFLSFKYCGSATGCWEERRKGSCKDTLYPGLGLEKFPIGNCKSNVERKLQEDKEVGGR